MSLSEITSKGMYIATYYENSYLVVKMCTKKQFLRELAGMDSKQQTKICNTVKFERM